MNNLKKVLMFPIITNFKNYFSLENKSDLVCRRNKRIRIFFFFCVGQCKDHVVLQLETPEFWIWGIPWPSSGQDFSLSLPAWDVAETKNKHTKPIPLKTTNTQILNLDTLLLVTLFIAFYYTIKLCNFILQKIRDNSTCLVELHSLKVNDTP